MGMANINITFTEKAKTVAKRAAAETVGLILRGAVPGENPAHVTNESEIPKNLSAENKEQVQLALQGYQNQPSKVVVYCIGKDDDYTAAFDYFEMNAVNYLAIPTIETEEKTDELKNWIKAQRAEGRILKAVLPNTPADHEGIINYATEEIIVGDKTYSTEKYCSRIAGILAGTPLTISCTYAQIPEATDCTRLKRDEIDKAVDAGKLIVFNDGEKVKIARGVNSLTTETEDKGKQFKKIKIVDAMDTIQSDIRRLAEDVYIGKYGNTYDNKCLLISAIQEYFSELQKQGILHDYEIGIDIPANKEYLNSIGTDVTELSDDEIKMATTDDKVFIAGTLKILDAIEDIRVSITV